jgi:hypothetical protein
LIFMVLFDRASNLKAKSVAVFYLQQPGLAVEEGQHFGAVKA